MRSTSSMISLADSSISFPSEVSSMPEFFRRKMEKPSSCSSCRTEALRDGCARYRFWAALLIDPLRLISTTYSSCLRFIPSAPLPGPPLVPVNFVRSLHTLFLLKIYHRILFL